MCCSHTAEEWVGSGLTHPQKWHFGATKGCHSSCEKPGLNMECQRQVAHGNGRVEARPKGMDVGDLAVQAASLVPRGDLDLQTEPLQHFTCVS